MKTLILYRHTKSSKDDPTLPDIERPLDERGKKNAKTQAKILKKLKLDVDYFFVSPSLRTKKTFKPLIKALKIKRKQYGHYDELYECSGSDLKKFIKGIDPDYKTVMIIGHNPSIESFIRRNTSKKHTLIPTGTIIILESTSGKYPYKVVDLIKP